MHQISEQTPDKKDHSILLNILLILSFLIFVFPEPGSGRIYIDINAPSIQKFRTAIPDFNNLTKQNQHPEMAAKLTNVVINDLDLSGYFNCIDKEAYLAGQNSPLTENNIRFKDWSVIGAELLLLGNYTCIGKNLEVEIRLYDVFSGRQILGKRALGDLTTYRYLMHRLSNEIVLKLTGHASIFLTKIAFVSSVSGHKEIFICDYDGHHLCQITKDKNIALLPKLSRDGKKITYTSYKEGAPMLYLGDIASGKIKCLSGRSGMNSGASWSPGNDRLALTMSRNGNPDIYLIDLNGKILKRLTRYWGIDVSPAFSPDGKKLAFVSNRSGSPQIYVLDLFTGKENRLSFSGKYNTSPTWSSLNRIAFVSQVNGTLDIFSMDSSGGKLKRLTENQGKNEDPCWSPDGRYIVFSSNRNGPFKLYIMNANGQNQKKISSSAGSHTSPSWEY